MRRLVVGALAGVTLTLAPAVAASPEAPDPSKLAANPPDPIDSTWVEAPVEAAQYLDGPVTYENLRLYYTYYHQTESFIAYVIATLRDNHFVAGYQRMWYRPKANDILTERVYVFADGADASSAMAAYKALEDAQGATPTHFDPGLGSTAYGVLQTSNVANYLYVGFTKGDALYMAVMASDKTLAPDYVIPQARLLWDRAPATISLSAPPAGRPPLVSRDWLFVIAGLWVALSIALVAVVVAIVGFVRRKAATPARAPVSTSEAPPV